MIGHSHEFCAPLPRHIFQGGWIAGGGFCGWVGVRISLYIAYRPLAHAKERKMEGWRLYASISLIPLCSVSCVNIVFGSRVPAVNFQRVASCPSISLGCWGIFTGLHCPTTQPNLPSPPLETLSGYRGWPFWTHYPLLLGVLTRITLTDSRKFPLT